MNILAIGAHWDDIELGCGLTLKKLNEKNHDWKILSKQLLSKFNTLL
jgi:LmbE family N-acetylglucosaminyl deacetylase